MKHVILFLASLLTSVLSARADFVECIISSDAGIAIPVEIEADNVQTLTGGITQISHRLGKLNVRGSEVELEVVRTPSTREQFTKVLNKAKKANTADELMKAARWALKKGLIPEFKSTVDEVLKVDPNDKSALAVKELEKLMDVPITDSSEQEKLLKKYCRKGDMKIAMSKHYILMHDTPETAPKPRRGEKPRKPRAEERLELLERVYETFLYRFYANGVKLEVPKERLMVLLFRDYQAYLAFSTAMDPSLSSAAGFWSDTTNIATFYDQGTHDQFKELVEIAKIFDNHANKIKNGDPGKGDAIRFADALNLIVRIEQENLDIEVVSHECTHQMAGNTGLLPRRVDVPGWVHEGLATYFEAPANATWAGIGAVNEDRIKRYRFLADDPEHSNVDFIVSNEVFDQSGDHHGNVLHAYAQSWALTHYLMEERFEEFVNFYRRLGEMPPDLRLSPEMLRKLFDASFPEGRDAVNQQWKGYMAGLQTDRELIGKD
jgi:hypothetical protein